MGPYGSSSLAPVKEGEGGIQTPNFWLIQTNPHTFIKTSASPHLVICWVTLILQKMLLSEPLCINVTICLAFQLLEWKKTSFFLKKFLQKICQVPSAEWTSKVNGGVVVVLINISSVQSRDIEYGLFMYLKYFPRPLIGRGPKVAYIIERSY